MHGSGQNFMCRGGRVQPVKKQVAFTAAERDAGFGGVAERGDLAVEHGVGVEQVHLQGALLQCIGQGRIEIATEIGGQRIAKGGLRRPTGSLRVTQSGLFFCSIFSNSKCF